MKEWMIIVIELLSLAALFYGVSLVYLPAAFILAGIAGVLICERATARIASEEQAKKGKK